MTPAAAAIAGEIRAAGPIPFSRYMQLALYDPRFGYYRGRRDPFGTAGDFYTAAQLQPVFGRLVAAEMRRLRALRGEPAPFEVVDWGAGRGELAPYLAEFGYRAMDAGDAAAPQPVTGVVFANELFDALPVDAARRAGGQWREMRVGCDGQRFHWTPGAPLAGDALALALEHSRPFDAERELWMELPVRLEAEVARIGAALERGFLLAVDYGYTARETLRFPAGTLMSYRRHRASGAVLEDPGDVDITAHVPFDLLERAAARHGLRLLSKQRMSRWLLGVGENDAFAAALAAPGEAEALRLRMQLKTLLFSFGESFDALLFEKGPKS